MSEHQTNEMSKMRIICPFYDSCILPKNYNCNDYKTINVCSEFLLKKKNLSNK
ncbi:MAG: hypothetical protein ACFFD2_17945 [Promethearchaeota archaeon]